MTFDLAPLSPLILREMVSRWVPARQVPSQFHIRTDTTDFFRVGYDDFVILEGKPYFIRHNAKELRFGLDEEVKYWVKHAIDLTTGELKIMKLVFLEQFVTHVRGDRFEFFRSPDKEAKILDLVRKHKNFMHGLPVRDEKHNLVRIIDFIKGEPLSTYIIKWPGNHETYFHRCFPGILDCFVESVRAIQFLHDSGLKHGDVRRDHIIVDEEYGKYRWIDFDYDFRSQDAMYLYDIYGLGNVLAFLVGKGDVLLSDLKKEGNPVLNALEDEDINIIFNNRVVNLRKIYPYIPEPLNAVLMRFSKSAPRFYATARDLLRDLQEMRTYL